MANTNFQQTRGANFYPGNRRPVATDTAPKARHPSEPMVPQNGVIVPGVRIDQKFAPGNAITRMKERLNRR